MPGRTPVVAVVDDEQPVRRALQRLLRASGFDVRLFATGSDFMSHLEGIDCVILDLHLPGMSGFEVQEAADEFVHVLALKHERHFVNAVVHVLFLDHPFVGHVAKQRNLLAQFLVE